MDPPRLAGHGPRGCTRPPSRRGRVRRTTRALWRSPGLRRAGRAARCWRRSRRSATSPSAACARWASAPHVQLVRRDGRDVSTLYGRGGDVCKVGQRPVRGCARWSARSAVGPAAPNPRAAPPSPPRTKWTRRVLHPVLIGHAASLTPALQAQIDLDELPERAVQVKRPPANSPGAGAAGHEVTRCEARNLTVRGPPEGRQIPPDPRFAAEDGRLLNTHVRVSPRALPPCRGTRCTSTCILTHLPR